MRRVDRHFRQDRKIESAGAERCNSLRDLASSAGFNGFNRSLSFSVSVSGDVTVVGVFGRDGRSRAGRRPPQPSRRRGPGVVDSPPEDAAEDRAAGAAEPARLLEQHDRLFQGVRRPRHGAEVRGQGGDGADQGEGAAAAVHALHDRRLPLHLRHQVHQSAAGRVQGQLREGLPGKDRDKTPIDLPTLPQPLFDH